MRASGCSEENCWSADALHRCIPTVGASRTRLELRDSRPAAEWQRPLLGSAIRVSVFMLFPVSTKATCRSTALCKRQTIVEEC